MTPEGLCSPGFPGEQGAPAVSPPGAHPLLLSRIGSQAEVGPLKTNPIWSVAPKSTRTEEMPVPCVQAFLVFCIFYSERVIRCLKLNVESICQRMDEYIHQGIYSTRKLLCFIDGFGEDVVSVEGYVISLIGLLCKQGVCSHLFYFISLLFKEGIFMERIAFQEWGGFLWFCEDLRISPWGDVAGRLCAADSCLSCAHRSIRVLVEEEAGGVLSAPAPLKPGGSQEGQTRAEGPGGESWAEGVCRFLCSCVGERPSVGAHQSCPRGSSGSRSEDGGRDLGKTTCEGGRGREPSRGQRRVGKQVRSGRNVDGEEEMAGVG